MSITTFSELKTAVGSWLNKTNLTASVPDFVRLAEQRIYYGAEAPFPSAPLRIPAMQARETGTISSNTIDFPTRFVEPIRVAVSSGGNTQSLTYTPPERFSGASNSSSPPSCYTYLNNSIQTAGSGASSYTLDYYQSFELLSEDADTNWLLTNAPAVYLYGALLESAPFLYDDNRLQTWHAMYKAAITAVNRTANRQGGGSLVTRVVA
jgi:hypothetical protein